MPGNLSLHSTKLILTFVAILLVSEALAATDVLNVTDSINLTSAGNKDIFGKMENFTQKELKSFRLPPSVTPWHYVLEIQPLMKDRAKENFTFKGLVQIEFVCNNVTNNVTLHAKGLDVNTSAIRFTGDGPQYTNFSTDTERNFFTIEFSGNLEQNKIYILELRFSGEMNGQGAGLFYGPYETDNKTISYGAFTQFEAIHAREVFPCFDEPGLKATFEITVVRPRDMISLSNTYIVKDSETTEESGITYVKDVYALSPKMSTYLVAFAVMDFTSVEKFSAYGVKVRVFSEHKYSNFSQFMLEKTVIALDFFEKYFGINYSMKKLDSIVIPNLGLEGMENWGMIAYNPGVIDFSDDNNSRSLIKEVALSTIAEEVAHQWLGNIITMLWWDDIWLKDGFATYMSYFGVDNMFPEWDFLDTFAIDIQQSIMEREDTTSSHPVYIMTQSEPDSIVNNKGASLLRMLDFVVGQETFKRGLNRYIKSKLFASATHEDLWKAMSEQYYEDTGKQLDVKAFMDTWIHQMNYPMVTVQPAPDHDKTLNVTQKRFLVSRDDKELGEQVSPYNYTWTIPLTFATNVNPDFNMNQKTIYWLDKNETSKLIRLNGNDDICPCGWYIANVHQVGFFRVNYPVRNWVALAKQLMTDHKVISIVNRAQIIDDVFNIAKAGYLDIDIPFKVIKYLEQEREYVPWKAALNELYDISKLLGHTELEKPFKNFLNDKLRPVFKKLASNRRGFSHMERQLLEMVSSYACFNGLEECIDEAKLQYQLWNKSSNNFIIDANIRFRVLCAAIATGGRQPFLDAQEMVKNNHTFSEDLYLAMACTKDLELSIRQATEIFALDSKVTGLQIFYIFINMISSSPTIKTLAWLYFRANYGQLVQKNSYLSQIITNMAESFNTKQELEQLQDFIESNKGRLGVGEPHLVKAVEVVKRKMKWLDDNKIIIQKYLKHEGYIKA